MNSGKQGFTLLEILIAISIFAIVISLAYSSYNATFHIINSAESQTATYSKARIAMERIRGDLESFYPGKEIFFKGTTETIGNRRADTLQFLSTAHIQLHPDDAPSGPILIRYLVQEDPNSDALLLYRSTQSATDDLKIEDDEQTALLLCDNLLEVIFDYQNKDGENIENWGKDETEEERATLPDMITISLRFNNPEEETGTLFQTGLRIPTAAKK